MHFVTKHLLESKILHPQSKITISPLDTSKFPEEVVCFSLKIATLFGDWGNPVLDNKCYRTCFACCPAMDLALRFNLDLVADVLNI